MTDKSKESTVEERREKFQEYCKYNKVRLKNWINDFKAISEKGTILDKYTASTVAHIEKELILLWGTTEKLGEEIFSNQEVSDLMHKNMKQSDEIIETLNEKIKLLHEMLSFSFEIHAKTFHGINKNISKKSEVKTLKSQNVIMEERLREVEKLDKIFKNNETKQKKLQMEHQDTLEELKKEDEKRFNDTWYHG